MRRLNRFEYVNTMRDLLGLNREYFDVTSDFSVDATEHGFDNNGEALILSDHRCSVTLRWQNQPSIRRHFLVSISQSVKAGPIEVSTSTE